MSSLRLGLLIVAAALVTGVGTGLLALGHHLGSTSTELAAVQREVAAAREHLAAVEKLQADMDAVELRAAQAAARLKAAQTTHQQELIAYAQQHRDDGCRLDADGLRLWRTANARAHPDSERDAVDAPGVPAGAAAAGRLAPGAGGQPQPARGSVPGVRGQAPRTGAGALPPAGGATGAVR